MTELIQLPNGKTLTYRDEDHSYWRGQPDDGTRLLGVTTVVKVFDCNPDPIVNWAVRTQAAGIAQLYEAGGDLDWLASPDSIKRKLRDHGLDHVSAREQAAEQGTDLHLYFEALAGVGAAPPLSRKQEEIAASIDAFWEAHRPEVAEIEQVVYSERLRVAGRLDFRGSLAECDDPACACQPGIGVIDLKTGKTITKGAHAQVGGAYPLLARESGFGETAWSAILQVSERGYKLRAAKGRAEDFEAAVQLCHAAAGIRRLSAGG